MTPLRPPQCLDALRGWRDQPFIKVVTGRIGSDGSTWGRMVGMDSWLIVLGVIVVAAVAGLLAFALARRRRRRQPLTDLRREAERARRQADRPGVRGAAGDVGQATPAGAVQK
ncbi:MAG: hypothetical protein LBU05_02625, partial [Bifidobacteriaceae bacterium]|nr:hypothetical protein [Bifidobacteriaceae bacterium]